MTDRSFNALVLSVSGQSVTISLDEQGGTDTIQKLRHVSCDPGDLAHVVSTGRAWFVDGVIGSGTSPAPEPALSVPPPAPQDIASGSWLFGPIDPGTWRGGDWRTDTTLLFQGVYGSGLAQYGAAWYGDGPSSLPGSLAAASLSLLRTEGLGGILTPTMALYAGTSRADVPDGLAPTVLATQVGPPLALNVASDWNLPDDWLSRLTDGSAGGLGCYLPSVTPALALSTAGSGMTLTCRWLDA